jgi:hypothetical protein
MTETSQQIPGQKDSDDLQHLAESHAARCDGCPAEGMGGVRCEGAPGSCSYCDGICNHQVKHEEAITA